MEVIALSRLALRRRAALAAALALPLPLPLLAAQAQSDLHIELPKRLDWVIQAKAVYSAAESGSQALEKGGLIQVSDGKIAAISPSQSGGQGGAYFLEVAAVTPGMIDLSARITKGMASVEQSTEIAPHLKISDALDLFDERWLALARTGVTTALAAPLDYDVIGGLGAVVKTWGESAPEERIVRDGAVLRGAFGSMPSARNHPAFGSPTDFYARRPTTRMAVEWEHRKAFYAAHAARQESKSTDREQSALLSVLDGKLPYMVQAWATQDIRTAVYLKEELERELGGKPMMLIDAAAEAWREPAMLVRSQVAVVLPPYQLQGRTSDNAFFALDTAAKLAELGVPIALSAHGSTDAESTLDRQAGWAMRGGLDFDAALASVTIQPARLVGIAKRVGSLEVGKDADLVLWSGRPFEPTSAVIGVILDGRLILDPRPR